jgi:hypothetical protein
MTDLGATGEDDDSTTLGLDKEMDALQPPSANPAICNLEAADKCLTSFLMASTGSRTG